MAKEPKIGTLDIAEIDRWLSDPHAPIGELMAELPFLQSEAHARQFLEDVKEGLEDIRAGRIVSHERVVRDMEERRRRYRASAAE